MNTEKSLTVEERTRRIVQLHNGILQAMKMSLSNAIEAGKLLEQQKKSLKHGLFLAWIETLMPFSQKTAWNYMALYRHSDKLVTVTNLQEAYKQIEYIENKDQREHEKEQDWMIKQRIATGEKPEGWDRSTDRRFKTQQEEKAFEERVEKAFKPPKQEDPQEDESGFEELHEKINDFIENDRQDTDLKLDGYEDEKNQEHFFVSMENYVSRFPNINHRLQVIQNLIKKLRRMGVECQKAIASKK